MPTQMDLSLLYVLLPSTAFLAPVTRLPFAFQLLTIASVRLLVNFEVTRGRFCTHQVSGWRTDALGTIHIAYAFLGILGSDAAICSCKAVKSEYLEEVYSCLLVFCGVAGVQIWLSKVNRPIPFGTKWCRATRDQHLPRSSRLWRSQVPYSTAFRSWSAGAFLLRCGQTALQDQSQLIWFNHLSSVECWQASSHDVRSPLYWTQSLRLQSAWTLSEPRALEAVHITLDTS